MSKKILAIFLAVIFTLSCFTGLVYAVEQAAETGKITVEKICAAAGSTVDVDLVISENPGIAGALLTVEYDEMLTLKGCSNGASFAALDFTEPGEFKSPCNFWWDSLDAVATDDGTILTLTFEVSENAQKNKRLHVDVSYRYGDIYSYDMSSLNVGIVNGNVTVIDYKPGDVNGDGVINGKDVTLIRKYVAGGYNVDIKTAAANVNGDDVINGKDVTLIRRYSVGGYGVELIPEVPPCDHVMEHIPAVEETCTTDGNIEYWHCTECAELFKDAEGTEKIAVEQTVIPGHHIEVLIPAIPASATTPGYTEGLKCSRCDEILRAPEYIAPTGCSITYHLYGGDDYLMVNADALGLVNTNPDEYDSEKGLVLKNLTGVKGYIFDGWYDGEGANGQLVREIAAGTTGNVDLYARWTAREYTITLDSPDVEIPWAVHETTGSATGAYTVKYTISSGFPLKNLESYGYTFVGWSNDDGFITNRIPQGTTGNMTLHANWTSNRNRATSYSVENVKPIIIEDNIRGRFLFVYEIGILENVPLTLIKDYGNTDGITINDSYEYKDVVGETTAKEVAEIIASATTRSSGWTLSHNWEDIYETTNEDESVISKSEVRTDSEGTTTGGNYFVSNSSGGSSYVSSSSGGSSSSCSKVTTENSVGLNKSIDTNTEGYIDAKLGVKNEFEVSAGVSLPVKFVDVSAGVKNTTTVSAELDAGIRHEVSTHEDESRNSYLGTYNENNESSYYDTTAGSTSTWNSEKGFSSSYSTSRDTSVSNSVSKQVAKKTGYSIANSTGGENSEHVEVGGTESRSDEYSTRFCYTKGTSTTKTATVQRTASANGYYRLVEAGTVHVFGVVGYDIAASSYFTYNYSVLDDKTSEYLDFSKEHANFKGDCENAILPFEIPIYVNEYVQAVTERTEGLEFALEGKVTAKYTGTSTQVVLPQYYSSNNGVDQTATAVKVTGFEAGVFQGNTNIEKVILPIYVSEIPDGAFKGCTNLKTVIGLGITKIGAHAFEGCTELDDFGVTWHVTSIGEGAFDGVTALSVDARDSGVADSTIASGAKRIILNLGTMEGSYDNKEITIDSDKEYFALLGRGETYKNLKIVSDAKETYISYMTLTENNDTPLKISSEKVTFNRLSVLNAPAFALALTGDDVVAALYGNVVFESKTDNAVLCKKVTLSKENPEVQGIIKSYGNVLTCGGYDDLAGNSMLVFTNEDKVISVTEEEYEKYLTSSRILFDANGGTVGETERIVYYGQVFGELPTATRANYNFIGWFTEVSGGTQITADTPVTVLGERTLYAHWSTKEYTVTFDANGGTGTTTKVLNYGDSLGTLPTPSRAHYTFAGWFTERSGGTQVNSSTVMSEAKDVTFYAHWTIVPYSVSWYTGTGYTISVNRTSSPNAWAGTGYLGNGAAVYYGDVLSITYSATTGYSISGHGSTSVTVTGNVNSSVIYATASPNSYTYTILYRSSNGTDLGSSSATYNYGTTNTIYAPDKSGYYTPGSQTIAWDSTSKTITFYYSVYTPSNNVQVASGNWWVGSDGKVRIWYGVNAEWRNRTSNSIQVQLIWTNTIRAYSYYGYGQSFSASIGGVGTGNVQICSNSTWASQTTSERSQTAYSGWVTVPVSATDTSVSISASWWDVYGRSGSWSNTLTIPAY